MHQYIGLKSKLNLKAMEFVLDAVLVVNRIPARSPFPKYSVVADVFFPSEFGPAARPIQKRWCCTRYWSDASYLRRTMVSGDCILKLGIVCVKIFFLK